MPQIYEDKQDAAARKPCNAAGISPDTCLAAQLRLKSQHTRIVDRSKGPSEPLEQVQDENVPSPESLSRTPSGPRFKNVLDTFPSTPKRRVRTQGGLLTPQTPRVYNASVTRADNVYTRARRLFAHSGSPTKLIGRDSERAQLQRIAKEAKTEQHGSCTYISGPPGTGKSALVHEVLDGLREDPAYCVSIVNCLGLTNAAQVYDRLIQNLLPNAKSKVAPEARLKQLFTTKRAKQLSHVIMLDEIDSLVDIECEVLYNIFE